MLLLFTSSWALLVGRFQLGASSWALPVGRFQLGTFSWALLVGPRPQEGGSVRWSGHRKDGVPRKLVAQYGGLVHRKDGAPRKLVAQVV